MVSQFVELLPLLNLLLLPALAGVWKLSDRLARIETTQVEHARRITVNEKFRERQTQQSERLT